MTSLRKEEKYKMKKANEKSVDALSVISRDNRNVCRFIRLSLHE